MRLHTHHEAAAEELETVDAHLKSTNASPLPSYTGHNSPLELAHLPAHMEFSIIIAGSNIGSVNVYKKRKREREIYIHILYVQEKIIQKYFILCFFSIKYVSIYVR